MKFTHLKDTIMEYNLLDKLKIIFLGLLFAHFLVGCRQKEVVTPTVYSNDIYDLKVYKVERHPPVVRNGFGIDIYHQGNSGLDTMYLSDSLPSWHPNACNDKGIHLYRSSNGQKVEFSYDLLFYNEFAYSQNYAGDYNGTGYPVIFIYTDPGKEKNSTKAAMVGIGVNFFNAFTIDSITPQRIDLLKSDPVIDLSKYRTEIHTATVDGVIMLQDDAYKLYSTLVIGNKFRPSIGGVITGITADDVNQINFQPVFLIKTREGLYAKFMVTLFKGVGVDTQKLTLQWQALKQGENN